MAITNEVLDEILQAKKLHTTNSDDVYSDYPLLMLFVSHQNNFLQVLL